MKSSWINKKGNSKCILYFSGWAMDENAVKHLNTEDYDICLFSNYNTIDKIFEDEFKSYNELFLVAWSLGVWVAAKSLSSTNISINKAIAINGTLLPINKQYGIPPEIFQLTINGWNEKNRARFNMRVMGGMNLYKTHTDKVGLDTVAKQKTELEVLQQTIFNEGKQTLQFTCSLIGMNDLIFPTQNQHNYWQNKCRIIEKDMPHFPFLAFNNWKQIIEL